MTAHPLAGSFSVEASARRLRQYRYVEERMMRMLGGWIALTPELPVKVLFGRHVWDCAQHADLWGRRLPELRAPAQQSEPASAGVAAFMDALENREAGPETVERITGVYAVLKPHLVATYAEHLERANPVYEPPTRRILERCLAEERRHVAAARAILGRLFADGASRRRAEAWERELLDRLAAAGGVTGDQVPLARAATGWESVDPRGDLVALDSRFDPGVIAPDLRAALDAHAAALAGGDWSRLQAQAAAALRPRLAEVYGPLVPTGAAEIVAHARVGAYRLVKVCVRDRGGEVRVALQQWREQAGGWRIVEVEILR